MAVVMDPRTGDILALAIRPTFNPNAFLDVPSKDVTVDDIMKMDKIDIATLKQAYKSK